MKNWTMIIFTAMLIFAFASADNAISPLVEKLHEFFLVPMPTILLLISSCTFGIVLGTFVGPVLIQNRQRKWLLLAVLGVTLSTLFFTITKLFYLALLWRTLFGFACGILASIVWWLTFQVADSKTSDAMVVVTMTARPLALCIGVPIAGFLATKTNWQVAFWIFLLIMILSGLILFSSTDKQAKNTINKQALLQEYRSVFRVQYSFRFYMGIVFNGMAYFGFYGLAGLWFIQQYKLKLDVIAMLFLVIGFSEVAVSFIAPWLYRKFRNKNLLAFISIIDVVSFGLFISGDLPLALAVAMIMVFIIANRIFLFPIVKSIPTVFVTHENKATLGSLVTLSLWFGFAIVSWLEAKMLMITGMGAVAFMLMLCLMLSVVVSFYVQKQAVFVKDNSIRS